VLVLGAFGIATVKLLANLLTAQNQPLATAPAVGASLVVTIVLDILLIPSMEGLGAAIASSVAYTVGGLVIAVEVMRRFRLGPRALLPGREDLRLLRAMIAALRSRPAKDPAD
jgi:Na+-driven multidrug efflux pump